jgi:hypothetical protein
MIKVQIFKNIGSVKIQENSTFRTDRFNETSLFECTATKMCDSKLFLKELLIKKLSITCLADAHDDLVHANCAVADLHGKKKTIVEIMEAINSKEVPTPLLISNLLEKNSSIEIVVKLHYFYEPLSNEGEDHFSSYSLFIDDLQNFKKPETNFESLRNINSKISLITENFMNEFISEHCDSVFEINTIEIHFRFNKKK